MNRPLRDLLLPAAGIALLAVISGCTAHPPGERAERLAALNAQHAFEAVAPLPADPSLDELVRYALLTNSDLEQRYWQWRWAIEQIPQDGTQPTNLVLSAGLPITHGSTNFDRTTLTAANDPMADIQWPTKPTTAARRALEDARAAGLRFQKARYDLRRKLLLAYYDYALTAEQIRLQQADETLLETAVVFASANNRAGAGNQQDLLKARNAVDLSRNQIAQLQSQLPIERAALNALLDRKPSATIPVPMTLPARREMNYTDDQLLQLAAQRNPELAALAHEIRGRKDGIELAKLQYFPDFSLSASSDLAGAAQSLMGMITVPLLRYQAIDAAIAQAQANLRITQAMRQQTRNDLNAQVILDIATLRDCDRQLELFERTILPRLRQVVEDVRSAYQVGHATLLDLLDSQRSLIDIQRLVVNLRIERERRLADLEAIAAVDVHDAPE